MTYHEEQRLQALERRIDALEQTQHGSLVKGWSAAARVMGVSEPTVRRRFRTDPRFPKPTNMRIIRTKTDVRTSPEWTLSQLTSYR